MKTKHKVIAGGIVAVVAVAGAILSHHGRIGSSDIYPPAYATGVTNPNVTQDNIGSTICVSGWTATIRPPASYTSGLKLKQMNELGMNIPLASVEEDHLISLELGGNPTDPANLWPQPYNPSTPDGGAHQKDKTENYLKAQVCSRAMTLQEAQKEIVGDWYAVYRSKVASQLGASPVDIGDPDDE